MAEVLARQHEQIKSRLSHPLSIDLQLATSRNFTRRGPAASGEPTEDCNRELRSDRNGGWIEQFKVCSSPHVHYARS